MGPVLHVQYLKELKKEVEDVVQTFVMIDKDYFEQEFVKSVPITQEDNLMENHVPLIFATKDKCY